VAAVPVHRRTEDCGGVRAFLESAQAPSHPDRAIRAAEILGMLLDDEDCTGSASSERFDRRMLNRALAVLVETRARAV